MHLRFNVEDDMKFTKTMLADKERFLKFMERQEERQIKWFWRKIFWLTCIGMVIVRKEVVGVSLSMEEQLEKAVRKCLSVDVITLMRIRKFAKRARQYLIAYHATDSVQVNAIYSQSDRHGPVAVEKLIGKFRT